MATVDLISTTRVDHGQADAGHTEIVALAGGGFAVAWQADNAGHRARVFTQAFDANGAAIGGNVETDPKDSPGHVLGVPQLAALANGGYVVVYSDSNDDFRGRTFAANGTGAPIFDIVHSVPSFYEVAGLSDGDFLIHTNSSLQQYSPAGVAEGTLAPSAPGGIGRIFSYGDGYAGLWDYQTLTEGELFSAFYGVDFFGLTSNASQGSVLVASDFSIGPAPLGAFIPGSDKIFADLSGGRFAIVGSFGGYSIFFGDGQPIFNDGPGEEIAALPGGGVASLGVNGQTVTLYSYSAAGEQFADPVTVATDAKDAELAALPDGDVVVTYIDGTGAVQAKRYDVPEPVVDFQAGTAGDDTLTGTDESDYIRGLDGNDIIAGLGGHDLLFGGNGIDTISGGDGDDIISGGAGADILSGDDGNDRINGEAGDNQISGGAGDDVLSGSTGSDVIYGGSGNDVLNAGDSYFTDGKQDSLHGGAGDDTYFVNSVDDLVIETDPDSGGVDTVEVYFMTPTFSIAPFANVENIVALASYGTIPNYTLTGNDEANTILINRTSVGDLGADVLYGLGGDDTLIGGRGGDRLDGGAGMDIASYRNADGGVEAYLYRPALNGGASSDAVGDSYVSIEGLEGSAFDDTLVGDAGANRLEGGDGNDWLNGAAGDDQMLGGAGNDEMRGSTGADHYDGGAGVDTVDFALASGVNVFLDGSGTNGKAALGDTFVNVENVLGGIGADFIVGDTSANRLVGNDGNDILWGRAGDDQLEGGNGDDRLVGQQGNDALVGGAGADTFAFTLAPQDGGLDRTDDFAAGADKIEIDASMFGGGLVAGGPVQLVSGTNPSSAGFASGVFLYNTLNGFLSWDADGAGAGAAVSFFRIQNLPTLTAADFSVVA